MTSWRELQPEFRRIVFRDGPSEVARRIPAARATVYRLLDENRRPSLAVRDGVERMIQRDRQEKPR